MVTVTSHGVEPFVKKINELLAENPHNQLLTVYPNGRYGCHFSFWDITDVKAEEYIDHYFLRLMMHISETRTVEAAKIDLRDVDLIDIERKKGDACISVIFTTIPKKRS